MPVAASSSREVLHIAVGDAACHVSVHWQNLQGLAATNGTCSADVTHTTTPGSYCTPRALLVPSAATAATTSTTGASEEEQQQQPSTAVNPLILQSQQAHQLAHSLAYGSHSRYRISAAPIQQQQYQSTGRCVNWDDEEEEQDEYDEEDRRERERNDWERNLQPTEDALDQFWSGVLGPAKDEQLPTGAATSETEAASPTWRDFLVPPYSPTMILSPPRTYFTDSPDPMDDEAWVQDVLWEQVRQELEACDACQGLVLLQSSQVSHWGSALLQEWRDECSSKSPLVGHFIPPEQTCGQGHTEDDKIVSRLKAVVALDGATDLADCVVPLVAPTTAEAAARMGAAWESVTTPYRVNGAMSELAVASAYHPSVDDTAPQQLSFREFTRSLRRRQGRNLLHMSVHQNGNDQSFYDSVLAGTSCERDQRMRQPPTQRRSRDSTAGAWMNSMDSLVPSDTGARITNCSLHYHFAVATALRPSPKRPAVFAGTSNLATCLMQGMGIGCRPEQCMASVVNQSLRDLTHGGYGAGSYWKHLLPGTDSSFATTLNNSTLVYPFVYSFTAQGEAILSSRRTSRARSIYQRQVGGGALPEIDDMQMALEHMLDLRDAYTPPEGSGLVIHTDDDSPIDR